MELSYATIFKVMHSKDQKLQADNISGCYSPGPSKLDREHALSVGARTQLQQMSPHHAMQESQQRPLLHTAEGSLAQSGCKVDTIIITLIILNTSQANIGQDT